MRSLQDYINIYATIASNSNLQGDSVDMLVQMLAHASYISEVENVSYMQESSLEKAKLVNSKIQRCMDEMYSVFRGRNPRVILNIRPKTYFTFNPFDEIIKSNNFKVYYLGYYSGSTEVESGTGQVSVLEGFKYGPLTLSPEEGDGTYQILGLISAEVSGIVWQSTKQKNYYFENLSDNLSNDMWVVKNSSELVDVTTNFSDHIQERKIYDLTLPSFGSRLYVANVFNDGGLIQDTVLQANYFKYCKLSDFPAAELRKISLRGADLVEMLSPEDWGKMYPGKVYPYNFLTDTSLEIYDQSYKNYSAPGLIFLDSENRDSLDTIHYKASRDRYVNSLLRSNSDVGALLEEMYPDKISSGGTNYMYLATGDTGELTVYYAPKSTLNLLTSEEIEAYKDRVTFYINNTIHVEKGNAITAVFNIDLELYQAVDVTEKVQEILNGYAHKFGIYLDQKVDEIKSLISKISNVSNVREFGIDYLDASGISSVNWDKIESTYFNIESNINSIVRSRNTDNGVE